MAGSAFEYVRRFEQPDALLLDTFIVVRVDGRCFHRFCAEHGYARPNDARGLGVMNAAAVAVMREWGEAVLAFGESDEFSFVFPRKSSAFGRRASKLASGVASLFAAAFVLAWPSHFPGTPLARPPSFDARAIAYPTLRSVIDYVKWRQVDTHVNSLYNECFWALVDRGGASTSDAHARLKGTLSRDKHELLHGTFGINYARLPVAFRRGTTLARVRAGAELPPMASEGGGNGVGGRVSASIPDVGARTSRHCEGCHCRNVAHASGGVGDSIAVPAPIEPAVTAPEGAESVNSSPIIDATPAQDGGGGSVHGQQRVDGGKLRALHGASPTAVTSRGDSAAPLPPLDLPRTLLLCHPDFLVGGGASWLEALLGADEEAVR